MHMDIHVDVCTCIHMCVLSHVAMCTSGLRILYLCVHLCYVRALVCMIDINSIFRLYSHQYTLSDN